MYYTTLFFLEKQKKCTITALVAVVFAVDTDDASATAALDLPRQLTQLASAGERQVATYQGKTVAADVAVEDGEAYRR